jgi:hypothetical protein
MNNGNHAMFAQSFEQPLDGGFGPTPFGGITFAQEMDNMHGYLMRELG